MDGKSNMISLGKSNKEQASVKKSLDILQTQLSQNIKDKEISSAISSVITVFHLFGILKL